MTGSPRVLLVLGQGGAGASTVAAATAAAVARTGRKTLLLTDDLTGDLTGDALLGRPAAGAEEPTEVETGLYVDRSAPGAAAGRWEAVLQALPAILGSTADDPLEAAEVTTLPGLDALTTLLGLRGHVRSDRWDCVVLDPAHGAGLVALPSSLARYVRRLWPLEHRLDRLLNGQGPAADRGADPDAATAMQALDGAEDVLSELDDLVTGPATSVRLVVRPDRSGVAAARRTVPLLALHGARLDGVVANRVLPAAASPDGWWAGWRADQSVCCDRLAADLAPVPVHRAPLLARPPSGPAELAALGGQTYAGTDPLPARAPAAPWQVERPTGPGEDYVLSLALPLAERSGLRLARRGDELLVGVGGHRQAVPLASVLRRCRVGGARWEDDRLRVAFTPDPALWRSP